MVVDKGKSSPPALTLCHKGLVLDTPGQVIGLTDDEWHEARSPRQALSPIRAREVTWATIIGRARPQGSALGPELGMLLHGLFEAGRLSDKSGRTIGAADLSGNKDQFRLSVGHVAKLVEARWYRPPTAARMTFAATGASDTGAGAVVAEPGNDLEPFCAGRAELGRGHHQSGSPSTEREDANRTRSGQHSGGRHIAKHSPAPNKGLCGSWR